MPNRKICNRRRTTAARKSGCGYDCFGDEKLLTSLRFDIRKFRVSGRQRHKSRTAKKTGIRIWPTASGEIEGQLSHFLLGFLLFGRKAGNSPLKPVTLELCFFSRSTRSGLIAAIRLQSPKSMDLSSMRINLSFAEACQFLSCSHSGWPPMSVETVPL